MKSSFLVLVLLCCTATSPQFHLQASRALDSKAFDVIHYDAQLEPDIAARTLKGSVLIRLVSGADNLDSIAFNCGELTIDSVRENGVLQKFATQDNRLNIVLSQPAKALETREFEIVYHGAPRRGIRFFPDQMQVYTIFSTSQWRTRRSHTDGNRRHPFRLIFLVSQLDIFVP